MLQYIALLSEKKKEFKRERSEPGLTYVRCSAAWVGETPRGTGAPHLPPLYRISPKHSGTPMETPSSNNIFPLSANLPLLLST